MSNQSIMVFVTLPASTLVSTTRLENPFAATQSPHEMPENTNFGYKGE